MDCCSKYPDYRHHTTSAMLSGRIPGAVGGNIGSGIPGAFYSHMHPSMRYQHSMYRLSASGGYSGIGPSPSSSSSSNSSPSSASHSPASPSPYHTNYDRFASNYSNLPPYVYSANGGGFSYGNLNARAEINGYYGHYDSYNRLAASFLYHNYPLEPGLHGSSVYNSLYGHPGPGPGREYHHHPSNGNYHSGPPSLPYPTHHPFRHGHPPGHHHQQQQLHQPHHSQHHHSQAAHFNASKETYASPMSDIGSGSGSESGTCGGGGSQNDENPLSGAEVASTPSPSLVSSSAGSNSSSGSNGVMHSNYSLSPSMPAYLQSAGLANPHHHHHMQPGSPHGIQQHSTVYPYGVAKETKSRRTKDKEKFVDRMTTNRYAECSTPLDSSGASVERSETPYPTGHMNGYSSSPRQQNGYLPSNQSTNNCWSPYPNSPQSWTHQYSPKPHQKRVYSPRPQVSPVTSSHFFNKSRVLECDFIPSKKSRKKIKTEADDDSPDMREEIKNITPLPGFQQAFGSTEIGRFSETFFNTPESPLDPPYESEADTLSPQPWETGDSLEGPHFNLHIGATVVQPAPYSENHSSTGSPLESNYFSEIRCSDF